MPSCGRLFIQTWRHNKRSGAGDAAPAKRPHPAPPAKYALCLLSPLLVEDPPSSQGDDPGGAGCLRCGAHFPAGEAEAGAGNHGQSGGEAAANQGGRRINPPGAGQSSLLAARLGWVGGGRILPTGRNAFRLHCSSRARGGDIPACASAAPRPLAFIPRHRLARRTRRRRARSFLPACRALGRW